MMFIMAAPRILNEIAQGTIKTEWGRIMAEPSPMEAVEIVTERLKAAGVPTMVRVAFIAGAPLLAERLAIAEYKAKHPEVTRIAPEVLTYQQTADLILKDYPQLTTEEVGQMLKLLKIDETMKPIS